MSHETRIVEEISSLKAYVEREMACQRNAVTRIMEEVLTIKNELRKFNKERARDLESSSHFTAFPLHNVEQINNFEEQICKEESMQIQLLKPFCNLQKTFLKRIGGEDVAYFTRYSLKKIITDECATYFTWTGSKEKPAIQNYTFIRIIKGMKHSERYNTIIMLNNTFYYFRYVLFSLP
ncbi:hypothetical protein CVS40_9025 [Lucilia cuprina]|nr:hypothetical protein CVS40_9025 [Lucilia cuprina]